MVVYFWFKGVNANRFGGPWWARSSAEIKSPNLPNPLGFLGSIEPFLYAWAIDPNTNEVNTEGGCIAPPRSLNIEYSPTGHGR